MAEKSPAGFKELADTPPEVVESIGILLPLTDGTGLDQCRDV
jgi:hypothetical protein